MREAVVIAGMVAVVVAVAAPIRAADDLGATVYAARCTACHGEDGRGDGPVAAALDPPPRNFHDATFWKTRTLDDLRKTVRDGRPGTLMQAFGGVLSDEEIDAVVRHLTAFRPSEAPGDAPRGHGAASRAGAREDAPGRTDRH